MYIYIYKTDLICNFLLVCRILFCFYYLRGLYPFYNLSKCCLKGNNKGLSITRPSSLCLSIKYKLNLKMTACLKVSIFILSQSLEDSNHLGGNLDPTCFYSMTALETLKVKSTFKMEKCLLMLNLFPFKGSKEITFSLY